MTSLLDTYLLQRDGELLATMPLLTMPLLEESEGFLCAFEPTPAFEPYRALFEEHARLAERVSDDAGAALLEHFDRLERQVHGLDLTIRRADGPEIYRRPQLIVMGDQAHFLPLEES